MGLGGFIKRFSKTGRNLERKSRSLEKARQHAQIADIESQLDFRSREDPREQSMLRQSMFGRGLGKSTIHTQGMARLKDQQLRSRAALERQRDLAHRGLSLIKLRARAARRMLPFDIMDQLESTAGTALTLGMLGGGGKDQNSGSSYEWSE